MITENYTPRVRRYDVITLDPSEQRIEALEYRLDMLAKNNKQLCIDKAILETRIQRLELMISPQQHSKKVKKQAKSKQPM